MITMPLPDAKEIAHRRRSLGLTQTQLARRAGVSQSLVAKLEGGLVDAAYSKVKHLFEVLEELEAEREAVPIKAMSNRPVVGVQLTDSVGKAIGLMRHHAYSQLPVFEGERVVGSISEKNVTEYLAEGKDPTSLSKAKVSDLMGEAFPQVGEDTPREVVVSLLRHVPAVLVVKGGRVTGIVTRADLFKVVRGA
jgi:predicted transcriptional regulator